MPTLRLDLIVKDGGTKVLKKFGTTADKEMKFAKGAVKSLGTAFGIAATAAAAAAVKMGSVALQAASDFEETQAKFSVVFKDQIAQADSFAQNLAKNYNMSREESRRFLSSIQDLLVPMGMASDQATSMSNEVVKLAADLGSFNNLPTEQVMLDIQSALVGNFETMKKYGVVVNATTTAQKALEMGLADSKSELTANHKAMAAFQLITEGSSAAIGDVARNVDTWAYQQRRLEATFKDIKVEIGQAFLPVATHAMSEINKWVTENQDALVSMAQNGLLYVVKGFGWVIEALRFAELGFRGLKLVGALSIQAVVFALQQLVKALRIVITPMDAFIDLLVWTGKIENNPFDKLEASLEEFASVAADVTDQQLVDIEETNRRYDGFRDMIDTAAGAIENIATTSRETKTQVVADAKQMGNSYKQMSDVAIDAFDDLFAYDMKALGRKQKAYSDYHKQNWKDYKQTTKEAEKELTAQAKEVEKFSTTAENYLSSGIFNTFTSGMDGIKQTWQNMLNDMLSALAKWAASSILKSLFGGGGFSLPGLSLSGVGATAAGGSSALSLGSLGKKALGALGIGGGGGVAAGTVALASPVPAAAGMSAIGGGVGMGGGGAAAGAGLGAAAAGLGIFGAMALAPSILNKIFGNKYGGWGIRGFGGKPTQVGFDSFSGLPEYSGGTQRGLSINEWMGLASNDDLTDILRTVNSSRIGGYDTEKYKEVASSVDDFILSRMQQLLDSGASGSDVVNLRTNPGYGISTYTSSDLTPEKLFAGLEGSIAEFAATKGITVNITVNGSVTVDEFREEVINAVEEAGIYNNGAAIENVDLNAAGA